ncbi:MAG: hypothetical protein LBQ52_04480 [Helicobacteraceae bacterium]|jgi:phage terminase Nu1 subunit (DNA packaging protein)|nr:hypothetical protein [Helicobacteraceae bacterium]
MAGFDSAYVKPHENGADALVTSSRLARFAGVDKQTISDWRGEGMPAVKQFEKIYLYPMGECVKWCILNEKIKDVTLKERLPREAYAPAARDRLASALQKEFDLDIKKGLYFNIDEIKALDQKVMTQIKNGILLAETELCAELKDEELKVNIKKRFRQALENLTSLDDLVLKKPQFEQKSLFDD